jgi:hypothetical protein
MVRTSHSMLLCLSLAASVCPFATGAITVLGSSVMSGRANSLVFPFAAEYFGGGSLYESVWKDAEVAGASARSSVVTDSVPDPAHAGWPGVCGSFRGVGDAFASVSRPSGSSAQASSRVGLAFTSDGIFGITFKTAGQGTIELRGPEGEVVAACSGNNEIIGFLKSGSYMLIAEVFVDVNLSSSLEDHVSESGSFEFTVPGAGTVSGLGVGLGVLHCLRRRRRPAGD